MPSYQNFNSNKKFIPKELLNKNRVLTMSNNRKCDYLIVDVGNNLASIMAINNQGNSKDILVVKTFENKKFSELVDEAYWLCTEFGIRIILADIRGSGLGFIDTFKINIKQDYIQIKALDGNKINQFVNINEIVNDLNNGVLRFLQTPELAKNTYIKPFLGLSNIIEYHKETDKLIDEVNNLEIKMRLGNIVLGRLDDIIGKTRLNCLLMFYSYPMNCVDSENNTDNKQYDIAKRMAQYEVIHGTFYKYLFKCIENEKINVIFYHSNKNKIEQFKNIVKENNFVNLSEKYIDRIIVSKDRFEIIFLNSSQIRFIYASDNARGYRYHFAVVDREIEKDMFDNVIAGKSVLFDMAKRDGRLEKDNYCIDFIEM